MDRRMSEPRDTPDSEQAISAAFHRIRNNPQLWAAYNAGRNDAFIEADRERYRTPDSVPPALEAISQIAAALRSVSPAPALDDESGFLVYAVEWALDNERHKEPTPWDDLAPLWRELNADSRQRFIGRAERIRKLYGSGSPMPSAPTQDDVLARLAAMSDEELLETINARLHMIPESAWASRARAAREDFTVLYNHLTGASEESR